MNKIFSNDLFVTLQGFSSVLTDDMKTWRDDFKLVYARSLLIFSFSLPKILGLNEKQASFTPKLYVLLYTGGHKPCSDYTIEPVQNGVWIKQHTSGSVYELRCDDSRRINCNLICLNNPEGGVNWHYQVNYLLNLSIFHLNLFSLIQG